MNNILLGISKLKKSFLDSASLQSDILHFLSGDKDSLAEGDYSIYDGLGDMITIQYYHDDITVQRSIENSIEDTKVIFDGAYSDYVENFENLIAGKTESVLNSMKDSHLQDSLNTAAKGLQTNELFTVLLDKYLTNSRSSAVDLVNIIDTYKISGVDRSQLVQAISSAADENGIVSNVNFLSLMQGLAVESETQLNEGKITMDETKIFYVSNFLASAFSSLVETLVTTIGLLLTAVSRVIGLIFTAIGWLVSSIYSALTKNIPSKIVVDNPLSNTSWFKGPTWAKIIPWKDPSSIHPDATYAYSTVSDLESDSVAIVSDGPFDTCLWLNADHSLSINRFMTPSLHLGRASNWLMSQLSISWAPKTTLSSTATYTVSHGNGNATTFPDEVYLTEDEQLQFLQLTPEEMNDQLTSMYLLWCGISVLQTIRKNFNITLTVDVNTAWSDYQYTQSASLQALSESKLFAYRLLSFLYGWNLAGQGQNWYITGFANDACTKAAQHEITASEIIGSVEGALTYNGSQESGGVGTYPWTITYPYSCVRDSILGYRVKLNYQSGSDKYYYVTTLGNYLRTSAIPTDRMFIFPSYSESSALGVMVAVGAISTVVLVAGTLAIKAIKKKVWHKQLDRKQEVVKATSDYKDLPTQENFDKLYKAQKGYNFRAKMFGWDTYDAANEWFDAPSGSTNSSIDLSSISRLIKN